jgi:hypothetical protein
MTALIIPVLGVTVVSSKIFFHGPCAPSGIPARRSGQFPVRATANTTTGRSPMTPRLSRTFSSAGVAEPRHECFIWCHRGPTGKAGGLRSVVAQSVLVRHQLLVLNRGRQRAPQPARRRSDHRRFMYPFRAPGTRSPFRHRSEALHSVASAECAEENESTAGCFRPSGGGGPARRDRTQPSSTPSWPGNGGIPGSKITALVPDWRFEGPVVRSDSRGCGVAGSLLQCTLVGIVW